MGVILLPVSITQKWSRNDFYQVSKWLSSWVKSSDFVSWGWDIMWANILTCQCIIKSTTVVFTFTVILLDLFIRRFMPIWPNFYTIESQHGEPKMMGLVFVSCLRQQFDHFLGGYPFVRFPGGVLLSSDHFQVEGCWKIMRPRKGGSSQLLFE